MKSSKISAKSSLCLRAQLTYTRPPKSTFGRFRELITASSKQMLMAQPPTVRHRVRSDMNPHVCHPSQALLRAVGSWIEPWQQNWIYEAHYKQSLISLKVFKPKVQLYSARVKRSLCIRLGWRCFNSMCHAVALNSTVATGLSSKCLHYHLQVISHTATSFPVTWILLLFV